MPVTKKRKTPIHSRSNEEDVIFKKLKGIKGDMDNPKLRLWAKMICKGRHDNYTIPPQNTSLQETMLSMPHRHRCKWTTIKWTTITEHHNQFQKFQSQVLWIKMNLRYTIARLTSTSCSSSVLTIKMVDVELQRNGSDCGVLPWHTIAYDIISHQVHLALKHLLFAFSGCHFKSHKIQVYSKGENLLYMPW